MDFSEIEPKAFDRNLFHMIDDEWLLICTWDEENQRMNMMTASWGGFGILWNKQVCYLFVRPQRHTHKLLEGNARFSVCILPEEQRAALRVCGRDSGRDTDKAAKTNLTVFKTDGVSAVKEADVICILRQLYVGELKKSGFLDPALLKNYPIDDFHTVYVCEIEKILKKIDFEKALRQTLPLPILDKGR